MNDVEFITKTNGKRWENRAEGENNTYDCWGIVIASFREIEGIELPQLAGYASKKTATSTAAAEALATGKFTPSQPTNGAIMVIMDNHDNITHVGRCLHGRVLHATDPLGVRWDTYASINREFKNVGYYKYGAN